MRVLNVRPLHDLAAAPGGLASAPSSPMSADGELVFPFEGEGSVGRPAPWHTTAAAALEAVRELEAAVAPASEARRQLLVLTGLLLEACTVGAALFQRSTGRGTQGGDAAGHERRPRPQPTTPALHSR